MIKKYGEINGVIFRNHGYDPYSMSVKYKLSHSGNVNYVYVNSYTELKREIMTLTRGCNEENKI